ncbi:sensor histidine kinase [Oscillibacter sp. 1-3]|uniref:sensor histidine kinase n=1 Tax=Oscillibacter sp. 1-3 TaxID=1235797 RepID=UPI00033D627C|nr:ATP-binding protein [Oscillibacter sp. 1-3]EOS67354.1 hypothetical protein C816_00386 [Oscillibacter sp. 1-3]
MDWFSLLLEGLTLATLVTAHIAFTCRLSGKPAKRRYFGGYLLFLCAIDAISHVLALGEAFAAGGELLALFAFSRLALKSSRSLSCAAAVLAVYTSQLSSGIIGSLECIAFIGITGTPLLYPLVILAVLLAFALCWGSCQLILKCLPPQEEPAPYLRLPLLTTVFFFAAEVFFTQTVYGRLSVPAPAEPGKHLGLLALQVLGLSALLCTLHAYRRACQGQRAQAALDALSQAARAQRAYIREARAREERTRALRHDLNSHLTVLEGLLNTGAAEEAAAYLTSLRTAADALSPTFRTGSAVIDILLADKLETAQGITAEVSLLWPRESGVDDFDLCVIFANALDNAVRACLAAPEPRSLRITGSRQGNFYRLSFENTCPPGPLPPIGTGLRNVKAAAEKYHGAMQTEMEGGRFRLHVLLNISERPEGRSEQMS